MAVLVAYASALGSTREIAQHLASRMALALDDVECRSVEDVKAVSGYEAVVVGSAVHNQAWLPPALQFLARHSGELATKPVWAFSVGMADALPRLIRKRAAALQQERLAGVLSGQVALRGHELFSGVYHAGQMPTPLRDVFRLAGGRFGDLRDWDGVDSWADQVIAGLATPPSPAAPGAAAG